MSPQKCLFFLQFCKFLVIDNEGPGRKQLAYLGFCTTCDAMNRESLICLLMEQSPSWEANRFSASQEIPSILWNPNVHYRIQKYSPPVRILRQLDPVHTPTSHLLQIHLNIILPSTPGSPRWSLPLRFPHHKPVYASPLPHTRYIPRPSHSSRFYHPNHIGWGVQMNRESQNI